MTILMCEVVAGPRLLRHAPGHSRVTESRHQAALGGPGRTPRSGNLSSGGHLRSRRDTSGHATKTVRDREAPGSNPGPPTKVPLFELANKKRPANGCFSSTPVSWPPLISIRSIRVRFHSLLT